MITINIDTIYDKYKLFSRPTFLEGMARLFDASNSLQQYNYSDTPDNADAGELRNDFDIVGDDMRKVLKQYKEKYGKK